MPLIVADTSPLVYLLPIDHIDILPELFETILVPEAVHVELLNPLAPAPIPDWASALPSWVEVRKVRNAPDDAVLRPLGAGERAAIALALSTHAGLLLIDERKGTLAAMNKGLNVAGTLGILPRAARRELLNLGDAFDRQTHEFPLSAGNHGSASRFNRPTLVARAGRQNKMRGPFTGPDLETASPGYRLPSRCSLLRLDRTG